MTLNIPKRARVIDGTHRIIDTAGRLFGRKFDYVPVLFNLSGRSAGMYRRVNGRGEIRYNPHVFDRYFVDNLANTVPHEVAHYVVDKMYRRRVRPHGPEWRAVMVEFGVEPSVRCDYDISGLPQRRQRRFPYICGCREHLLSATRHNRIQSRRSTYYCRDCGSSLNLGKC